MDSSPDEDGRGDNLEVMMSYGGNIDATRQDNNEHQFSFSTSMRKPLQNNNDVMWDKTLVVFLVASGTVCFLTNILIVLILIRQKGKLCLRYQLILSQAWAGFGHLIVLVYPMTLTSITLNTSLTHRVSFESSTLFSSRWACLFLCSAPFIATTMLNLLHTTAIYIEQALHDLSLQSYKVLVSSPKIMRFIFIFIWLLSIMLAMPPFLHGHQHQLDLNHKMCQMSSLWSPFYSVLILTSMSLVGLAAVAVFISLQLSGGSKKWKSHKRSGNPGSYEQARRVEEERDMSTPRSTSVVIIEASHVSSEAVSASSLLASSKPFNRRKATFATLIVLLVLDLSATIYNVGLWTSHPPRVTTDPLMSWSWLLVILGGSMVPVVHLLTDDVISGLGLELIKSLKGLRAAEHGNSDDPNSENMPLNVANL